jgi:hypothetical protein
MAGVGGNGTLLCAAPSAMPSGLQRAALLIITVRALAVRRSGFEPSLYWVQLLAAHRFTDPG